jgi:hypothetical protein
MRKLTACVILTAFVLCAQTSRPVGTKALSSYQWVLTSLSACVSSACYPQANGSNDTADMYIGTVLGQNTNSGVASAGAVQVAGAITLTFTDGNAVNWSVSAFTATASGTTVYPLGALLGLYFSKGMSVTCAGAGCTAATLQVYYQR